MARERTPYFKRYPKIVRAKRIILPIAIGGVWWVPPRGRVRAACCFQS